MSARTKRRLTWLSIVLGLLVFGLVILKSDQTLAEEGGGGGTGTPETHGENENKDECEPDEQPKFDEGVRGDCMQALMAALKDIRGKGGTSDSGPSPTPKPGDSASPDDPEPAGEHQDGAAPHGKKTEDSNGTSESEPDAEGAAGSEDSDFTGDKPAADRDASEGSSGEGGDEGDGSHDRKGGEVEGKGMKNCEEVKVEGETPKPLNLDPPGGSKGNNPGFLNEPMRFVYRSFDTLDGQLGVGVDANVFERLVLNPTQNPTAAVAWYPGNGAAHYFYGPTGTTYTPEAAIQDTHTLTANPASTTQRYVLSDKYGNQTFFDVNGKITLKQDRCGHQNAYARNPSGQLTSISSSYGHSNMWSFAYHATGRLRSATDFSGRTTTFSYSATNHLTQVSFPQSLSNPSGKNFNMEYYFATGNPNIDGKMWKILDPLGNVRAEFGYNVQGKLIWVKRGNGAAQWSMTANGNTRDVVDFNGNTRRYTFQPGLHYPTRVELFSRNLRPGDPASYVWNYQYNAQRQLTQAVMPDGKKYDFTFDAKFNRTKTTVTTADATPQIAEWNWTYDANNLPLTVSNPLGNTWTYTRNAQGLVTKLATPDTGSGPAEHRYEYDANCRLIKSINPNGRVITFTRHTAGPLAGFLQSTTVSQEGGGETCVGISGVYAFDLNERGYGLKVTDPTGVELSIERDEVDRIKKVFTSGQVPMTTTVDYNALGLPEAVKRQNVDAAGNLHQAHPWIGLTVSYDARRRALAHTIDFDENGTMTWGWERDGLGNVTKATSPEGRVSQRTYDERGYVMTSTIGVVTPSSAAVAYWANGARKTVTDALGNTTSFQLDPFGRISEITRPTGEKRLRTLDKLGRTLTEETRDAADALFAKSTFAYDKRNRGVSVSHDRFGPGLTPETVTTTIDHDDLSNPIKATTPLGRTYSATYFSCGKPKTITDDQTGSMTTYTYDAAGRVVRTERTETEGGTTKVHKKEWDYDGLGRLEEERVFDADDPTHILTTKYILDGLGRLAELQSPEGVTTKYKYNFAGFLVESEEIRDVAVSYKTTYEWDKDGNLLSVTDTTGSKTSYEYDDRGWLTKVTQPDLTTITYTYDLNGRVKTYTDNNGTVVTNTYDNGGRLTNRSITRGTGVKGTTTETYTYDTVGRLTKATDDDSIVELVWDSLGNLLEEKQGPTAVSLLAIKTAYDKESRPTALTYPNGLVIDRTYDTAGRFFKALQSGNLLFERSYIRTSLISAQKSLLNVTLDQFAYDGFDRLTSFQFQQVPGGSGSPVAHFHAEYGYDDAHRRTYERRVHAGNVGELFAYDGLGRLKTAWRGIADPVAELAAPGSQTWTTKVDYTFDGVGARTQVTATPWAGAPATTLFGSNNQHEYTTVGTTQYGYDANGNRIGDGVLTYKYDFRNQLVEVRTLAGDNHVMSYEYDAFGRRIAKHTTTNETRYYHDGNDMVEVRNNAGVVTHQFVTGAGIDDHLLLYGRDLSDYDGDGNTTESLWFTYHLDGLNSVRLITDEAGAVVETYSYTEYGQMTIRNAAGNVIAASQVANFFTYTGRQYDPETGLSYYRARYYDPAVGAFLQRDPLGFVDGMNLYAYARSSPATFVDPYGTETIFELGGRLLGEIADGVGRGLAWLRDVNQTVGNAILATAKGTWKGLGPALQGTIEGGFQTFDYVRKGDFEGAASNFVRGVEESWGQVTDAVDRYQAGEATLAATVEEIASIVGPGAVLCYVGGKLMGTRGKGGRNGGKSAMKRLRKGNKVALDAFELGFKGTLDGNLSYANGILKAEINMAQRAAGADLANMIRLRDGFQQLASKLGAKEFQLHANIANERLLSHLHRLVRRYGGEGRTRMVGDRYVEVFKIKR